MENKFYRIIDHFGVENQQRKLQEEVFELQQEITIYQQGNNGRTKEIAEELIDVMILLKQFCYYYGLPEWNLQEIEKHKIERTLERIESGYYEK
jgi:NTP pyrophosphatase (non-canonical NTP hydrolase)